IRDRNVTGVQTCALPISWLSAPGRRKAGARSRSSRHGSRHRSPVAVTSAASRSSWLWGTVMPRLAEIDPDVAKALREEAQRQHRSEERRVGKEERAWEMP